MLGMKNLRKVVMPLGLSLLAVTVFMGCRADIAVRGRSYSDRVWSSDPYCSDYNYGYSYGCRYGRNDGLRIDYIQRRRWGGGWRNIEASTLAAAKPTTWEAEFKLKPRAVAFLKNSFNNALEGKTEQLQAIGISPTDIQKLAAFEMPSRESINTAARTLNVKSQDMKDFLEVFTIRMKAAFEANE
jgi:hypothetical protein